MKKIFYFIILLAAVQTTLAQWEALGPSFTWGISCMATLDNTMFIGNSLSRGVFISKDNGATWTQRDVYSDDGVSALTVFGNNIIACAERGVFFSSDTGKTWIARGKGIGIVSTMLLIGDEFYVGTNFGVFVSKDSCKSWIVKNNGLKNFNVLTMASINRTIIIGTEDGIYLSTDKGENWIAKNTGLTNLTIRTLCYKGDTIFAGTNERLFVSTDNAETWVDQLIGFSSISSIKTKGDNVLLGFKEGMFLSIDGGKKWTVVNGGLNAVYISSIYLYNDVAYIGAGDRLYRSTLKNLIATDVEEQPASPSSSLRISPLPVSGDYLMISSIPTSVYELRIYSLLGEIVHSETLNGAERRQINVSGLPAGVYYLQVGMGTRMVIKQ